jgi:hypothetical protein
MTANSDSEDATTAAAARKAIRDGIDTARTQVNEAAHGAISRTKDGIDQARTTAVDVYANSRERAADAYATAREKARSAGRSAADGLDSNPLGALIGGLALGAVIGALLPRTEREAKVLGVVGDKIQGAAREAAGAAKDAGREKLAELGISRDHARDTMKSLLDGVIAAAGSASAAAVETAKKPRTDGKDS